MVTASHVGARGLKVTTRNAPGVDHLPRPLYGRWKVEMSEMSDLKEVVREMSEIRDGERDNERGERCERDVREMMINMS